MMETFLCFESGDASFLLPLGQVRHIVSGNAGKEKAVTYMGADVEFCDIEASWTAGCEREYAVLLETECGMPAILADYVAGVFEVPEKRIFPLPPEAAGARNDFLTRVAYLEPGGGWAFVIDIEQFLNKERN